MYPFRAKEAERGGSAKIGKVRLNDRIGLGGRCQSDVYFLSFPLARLDRVPFLLQKTKKGPENEG